MDRQIQDAKANIRWVRRMGTGGVLLDLGSNIGEVSLACSQQFDSIVAVEANPDTYVTGLNRVAESGLLSSKIRMLNAAVHKETGMLMSISMPSRNSLGATVRPSHRKGVAAESVMTIALRDLVDEYRPRCIKMDIEGSEFHCLPFRFPSCVRCMVTEFHGRRGEAVEIVRDMREQGFLIENEKALDSSWSCCSIFFCR